MKRLSAIMACIKVTFLRWFVTPAKCPHCGGDMEEIHSPSGYLTCKNCGVYFE